MPAADGRVALAQAVAQAELEGVHPELAGDMVDVDLADVPAMEGAWRPHVPRGHEVGVDHVRLEAGVGDVVDAERFAATAGGVLCVGPTTAGGAAVQIGARMVGDDLAVSVHGRAQVVLRFVLRIAGAQLVRIGHDRLYRPSGLAGEKRARKFLDRVALASEVAADELAVDYDALAGHVEHARELLAQRERRLVRRDDLQPALVVEPDDAAVGLDEALVLARPDVNVLHHEVGSGEEPLDILLTLLAQGVAERVGVGTRPAAALAEVVVGGVGVEHGRVGAKRLLCVEDGRQLLPLDVD